MCFSCRWRHRACVPSRKFGDVIHFWFFSWSAGAFNSDCWRRLFTRIFSKWRLGSRILAGRVFGPCNSEYQKKSKIIMCDFVIAHSRPSRGTAIFFPIRHLDFQGMPRLQNPRGYGFWPFWWWISKKIEGYYVCLWDTALSILSLEWPPPVESKKTRRFSVLLRNYCMDSLENWTHVGSRAVA